MMFIKSKHKNFDYTVATILDGFDPESYIICFNIVKKFELDGEVEEVKIDGYTSFSNSSRYLPDVKIIVRYHTFFDN